MQGETKRFPLLTGGRRPQGIWYNSAMLKLGNFTLKSNVIQSPMAGCTDLPYRLIARQYGMEFAFLEMVAAESLVRKNEKTIEELMMTCAEDKPLGAQLMGCKADVMGEAAAIVEQMGFDLLDLNLGCPAPKVAGKGSGSALLACPDKAKDIFESVVKNVKKIPVTIKMRLGVTDPSGDEAVKIAKIAEDSGIVAVSVHGRTRVQGYSGQANYEAIGRVKSAVKIPVFGNGDVLGGEDALRLRRVAGCDGVMIGRGGLGNPWIFKNIEAVLNGTGTVHEPSFEEKKEALLKHMDLEVRYRDERSALFHMRRIACWYFAKMPNVAEFRGKINTCLDIGLMRQLIEDFGPGKPAEIYSS